MDSSPVVAPPYVVKPFALQPFRALLLSPTRVGDPSLARTLARPYRAVPRRLARWEASGLLVRENEPALYLHEYTASGVTIRGLVGTVSVARSSVTCPDGEQAIFPHEGVIPEQVTNLADRMEAMSLNPAPILLVHHGPPSVRAAVREVASRPPDRKFEDRSGQYHRMWAIREPEMLEELATGLAGSHALIADGHHRYAAYLALQASMPGTPWDHGLVMLVDQDDTPLWLGAIHRTLPKLDLIRLATAHADGPAVDLTDEATALSALGHDCLVLTDGTSWATVRIGEVPSPVQHLHRRLLPSWGVAPDQEIGYHHSLDETLKALAARRGSAVLMPAPTFDEVVNAASAHELLPQKATSFQPKPSLGVLMRSLPVE
ncbi:DUF1015 family protein [Nocardioides speluncae]|uniref:DUF1015 family protein n=1 Tax=Nocardioides speluncae TaxID=2670337 RepID=UPI000D6998D0|nr:DUF1015 family protein [Nocardioides speluncae]